MQLLSVQNIARLADFSEDKVWQLARRDPDFPKPLKLGHRTTRWRQDEIEKYFDLKAAQR